MRNQKSYLTPDIKALIGTKLTGDPDYVERNDIRFFAEAIRLPIAPKPLYSNEVYARRSRFGGLIAPPTYFTRLARRGGYPWPIPSLKSLQEWPGLGGGAEMEMAEPLRHGDTIYTNAKVADIYERDGIKGKLIFLVRDFEFTNQLGQYVGKIRRITVKFPESFPYDRPGEAKEELLHSGKPDIGTEISPFSNQVTLMELNQFAGANREWGRYHMDRDYAQSLGLKDVLVIETLKTAYVANMLEDWFGKNIWIQKLTTYYPIMDYVGDTLTSRGRVTSKVVRDGHTYVECDIWIENQRGERGTIGNATIALTEGN